jgi:hypothetical protein
MLRVVRNKLGLDSRRSTFDSFDSKNRVALTLRPKR